MTGLEKILAEIRDEALAEAEATRVQARAEAERLLAEARAAGEAAAAKANADADDTVAEIMRSRDSAKELQRRQNTLATKQALLGETLDAALQSLYALPETEYFALLVKLAAQAAQPGQGEMLLNQQDQKRLPAGFEKNLAAALPAGATLVVSQKTRPIDGGFVLSYGGVEENCSFAAMFDARRDEFSDKIRDTLFG